MICLLETVPNYESLVVELVFVCGNCPYAIKIKIPCNGNRNKWTIGGAGISS